MADLKLDAQPRTLTGRKVRQLRVQGLVPMVVYGKTQEPVNLQVSSRALETTLHQGGFSQLVQVNVEGGGSHNVLVREIQRHPVTHAFTHVDLYAVNMREKQHVSVPIVGIGKPDALVTGFMVLQALDAVEISALPPIYLPASRLILPRWMWTIPSPSPICPKSLVLSTWAIRTNMSSA